MHCARSLDMGPQLKLEASRSMLHIVCWSDNAATVSSKYSLSSSNTYSQEINQAIGFGEALFDQRLSANHLASSTNTMVDYASRA